MAVEKGKVLAKLDAKFKGKSLTKNFKDNLATKWAAKIDTDEEIDAYIEDREDVILEASTEADRRATQATAKAKADAAAAVTGKTDTDDKTDDVPDDTPAWAKAILQESKAARAEVAALKAERQTESIADRFKKDERLKGIPAELLHGRFPQKDEDYESSVEAAATVLKPFIDKLGTPSFGVDNPPLGGVQKTTGTGKVDADVLAFAKTKNDAALKSQTSKN